MRYWACNPELYDEIIVQEMTSQGLASEDEDPYDVLERWKIMKDGWKIATEAERKYWLALAC
jgi:hypothetical protein